LANHTDFSPAPSIDKPLAVLKAILENPNTKSLLLSFNYLQLLPCNILVGALCEALRQRDIDTTIFPIVVRVFGPGEDEARTMVKEFTGVRYMPPKTSLDEAVKLIVNLTNEAVAGRSIS
jgi:succinyl-CoA synthetase beta subunit